MSINQKIYFYFDDKNIVKKIKIPINFDTEVIIDITSNIFSINKEKNIILKEVKSEKFIIESSLYKDGIKAKIPIKILTDAIRLYSFDIDFQRDIKKNTKFYSLVMKLLS